MATLHKALATFHYMLSLLKCETLNDLPAELKDPEFEGLNAQEESHLFHLLKSRTYQNSRLTERQLYEYDQNIVAHTKAINKNRKDKVRWKYYQYLSLLFTEMYLDRYFGDREALLRELEDYRMNGFKNLRGYWHDIPAYKAEDLNKLAYWCATGSGKTLLMHINMKQYQYYAKKYGAKRMNQIILLTPNEGLSRQHNTELALSGFSAEIFSKNRGSLFSRQKVQVIDINKFNDKDGNKRVAVNSFGGNNLLLVDEGHKGSKSEDKTWLGYRNALSSQGFTFEYSATFGQAIGNQEDMMERYGKSILFDYSYYYFHKDGYGKDPCIMNMEEDMDREAINLYLAGYVLCLYDQMLAYDSDPDIRNKFLIEKPLGIFIGNSVNAVYTEKKQAKSDVLQIVLFLNDFISDRRKYSDHISRLIDPQRGVMFGNKNIFADSFTNVKAVGQSSEIIYDEILKKVFHSPQGGAALHIVKQTGDSGEIALCLGSERTDTAFGIINIGDSDKFLKLCQSEGLHTFSKDFAHDTLFNSINDEESPVNLLIGSRKFIEGWSSWRVSVLGLMKFGSQEGSLVVQLFGRGVRLKGYNLSLKRSQKLGMGDLPKGLKSLETLHVFGVQANYMNTFKEYLLSEGVKEDDNDYETIYIPTINLLPEDERLKTLSLKEPERFFKDVVVNPEVDNEGIMVELDWTPKVNALPTETLSQVQDTIGQEHQYLEPKHLNLLDWNSIYFALHQMKNERGYHNLLLTPQMLWQLMGITKQDNGNQHFKQPQWYHLYIQKEDLEFRNFAMDIQRWETITVCLLKDFITRVYKRYKARWESKNVQTLRLSKDDPNFVKQYSIKVKKDKSTWFANLTKLKQQIQDGQKDDLFVIDNDMYVKALGFDKHLYYPLMGIEDRTRQGSKVSLVDQEGNLLIKIAPVSLNSGEIKFVEDLRKYYQQVRDTTLKGKKLYLLRNESRRGVGFFNDCKFYPDFILWAIDGERQKVVFIDPKGLVHLPGGIRDPKITLYKYLRETVQPELNDSALELDSIIVSDTPYSTVSRAAKKYEFNENHVVFQEDKNYIEQLFQIIGL